MKPLLLAPHLALPATPYMGLLPNLTERITAHEPPVRDTPKDQCSLDPVRDDQS